MAKVNYTITGIDEEILGRFQALCEEEGITPTEALAGFIEEMINSREESEPELSPESEDAFRELQDIKSGKIPSKGYKNAREMFADIFGGDYDKK